MKPLPPLALTPMPTIDLRHLFVLTDGTGILQHATRATPDLHHGYCTDDNARALIAAVKVLALPRDLWCPNEAQTHGPKDVLVATQRYLAFLAYALNHEQGRFRNFMQYDRSWLEDVGSEDSHARTLWALGMAYRYAPTEDMRDLTNQLLHDALPAVEGFQYLRPWAYSLLGLDEYLAAGEGEDLSRRLHAWTAEQLFEVWLTNARADWPWWEPHLTWGNAKLPHALLVGGVALDREDMVDAALTSLRWLLTIQTGDQGQLSIIGNDGWYYRGQEPARFDQQPIEAKALVQACLAAAQVTRDAEWIEQAKRCFEWFLGRNDVHQPLYNPQTGGGHDGLWSGGVNANQGAESTLAYLMSVLELVHYDQVFRAQDHPASPPAAF